MCLVEIFDDGERLRQRERPVLQDRHQGLRVQLAECRGELLTAALRKVHRGLLVGETFEIERDADAVGGGAAEKAVQLHSQGTCSRHRPSAFCAGRSEKLNSTESAPASCSTRLHDGATNTSFSSHSKVLPSMRVRPRPSTTL